METKEQQLKDLAIAQIKRRRASTDDFADRLKEDPVFVAQNCSEMFKDAAYYGAWSWALDRLNKGADVKTIAKECQGMCGNYAAQGCSYEYRATDIYRQHYMAAIADIHTRIEFAGISGRF